MLEFGFFLIVVAFAACLGGVAYDIISTVRRDNKR